MISLTPSVSLKDHLQGGAKPCAGRRERRVFDRKALEELFFAALCSVLGPNAMLLHLLFLVGQAYAQCPDVDQQVGALVI